MVLVAIGKAAYAMAEAACSMLGERINQGIVITKYGHGGKALPRLVIREAGHPVLDENTLQATAEALEMVKSLQAEDRVLLLISGGGSALFESPCIPFEELKDITDQLLKSGADIVEMNTLRKRLSHVKGGRFAQACQPAQVFAVVLSDILGDPLDMIASGPAYPDSSSAEDARRVVEKYGIKLSAQAEICLQEETPKTLSNVETHITGSVRQLCLAAEQAAREMGYTPLVLTSSLDCIAREAGAFLAAIAREHQEGDSKAFILGGETVVKVTGKGKGGRNGDRPGSGAGHPGAPGHCRLLRALTAPMAPQTRRGILRRGQRGQDAARGIQAESWLEDNNANPALAACDGLIMTGPTGTNVNDLTVLLIKR